jgi:glycosyltransferase involved in cell wall biosynthesis
VVVPVRNEERHLAHTLDSLVAQEFPRDDYEIIVVDGQSTDATPTIVQDYVSRYPALVRVAANPARIVSAGRNVGTAHARGEIVAFVEGHARIESDFLATIQRDFTESGAECLGRYVDLFFADGNWLQRATALARRTFMGRNPHSGRFARKAPGMMSPLGVAVVYRRGLLERVGGYDERYTTNEDVELNWRIEAMGIAAYSSGRLVYHLQPRDSLRGLLRQMVNYGRGKRRFIADHPQGLRLAYAVPTAIIASAAGALPAWLIHPLAGAAVALPAGIYGLAAMAAGVAAARRGLGYLFTVPVALCGIALGFGLGFAIGPPRRSRDRALSLPAEGSRERP